MYFQNIPSTLSCLDHIKFLDLGMSCLVDQNTSLIAQNNIFLVESNFKTFFLRIEDEVLNYEIALLKTLKADNLVLKLYKHKVLQGRFAGIYHFVSNQNTLYKRIMNDTMGIYDILSYMQTIIRIVSIIFDGRNPQNEFLKINIMPSNLLIVDEEPYALKLITVIPRVEHSSDILSAPEDTVKTHGVDQKATHVYYLGKVFYFMLFQKYPDINETFFKQFLEVIRTKQIEGNSHESEILLLIRNMLNNSMVDRPGIVEVSERIKNLQQSQTYFLKSIQHNLVWKYQNMKNEIDYEMLRQTVGEDKIEELNSIQNSKLKCNFDTVIQLIQKRSKAVQRIEINHRRYLDELQTQKSSTFVKLNKAILEKYQKMNIYSTFMNQQLVADNYYKDTVGLNHDFEIADLLFTQMGKTHSHGTISAAFQFEYDLKDLISIVYDMLDGSFVNKNRIMVNPNTLKIYQPEEIEEQIQKGTNLEKINDVFLYLLKRDLEHILESQKVSEHNTIQQEAHSTTEGFFTVLSNDWPFLVIFIVSFTLCFVFLSILILKRVRIEVYKRAEFNTYVDLSSS